MAKLSPEQQALVNGPNYAFLATLMPDGSPQVSPVWIEADEEEVFVNTTPGRLKERNMRSDPRVALAIVDREDPENRQVLIRGVVIEMTAEGAVEQVNKLSRQYIGLDPFPPVAKGQERLKVVIRPDRVGGFL